MRKNTDDNDVYYVHKVIKTEHGTITIRRPILTEAERKKREQQVIDALARFGRAMEELEEKKRMAQIAQEGDSNEN